MESFGRHFSAICEWWKCASRTALLRRGLIGLFLLLGTAVAILVAIQQKRGAEQQHNEHLKQWCNERASMLSLEITANANHIKVFTALEEDFKAELMANGTRFQRYLDRTAYARPSVLGVDWTAVVRDEERAAFEARWNATIIDRQTNQSSERRDVYYPLTLSSSSINYLRFLDKQTISPFDDSWRAAVTAESVMTAPFSLAGREAGEMGFVICWPTYSRNVSIDAPLTEKVAAIDGMISAVFSFPLLVAKFEGKWAAIQSFSFHVFDVTDPTLPMELYIPRRERNRNMAERHLRRIVSLSFGEASRQHEMVCWYRRPSVCWSAVWWGLGVTVVVLLIDYVLWATISRMETAEENYVKMERLKMEAEAADRAKSTFLATMSHELRTPMNGVLGMLDILKNTSLDAQQMEYVRTAGSCGNALITLVNDILDLAKVESGHMDLERTHFDIRTICSEVLDVFQESARKKSIELATLVSPSVPAIIFGDPGRLRQVFINLVGNAIKFTQEGHVFLRISIIKPPPPTRLSISSSTLLWNLRTPPRANRLWPPYHGTLSGRETADDSNSWDALLHESTQEDAVNVHLIVKGGKREREYNKVLLHFSCEDTGVGIPPDVHQRIFSTFIQGDSATTRKYGGTGIGLSICQKLVGMMGSEISLVSKVGIGTTFSFTIEADAEATSTLSSSELILRINSDRNERTDTLTQLNGRRILVATPRLVRRLVLLDALQCLGLDLMVVDDLDSLAMIFFHEDSRIGRALSSSSLNREPKPDITPITEHHDISTTPHSDAPSSRGQTPADPPRERSIDFIFLDADDWGLELVLDFTERLWAEASRRGMRDEGLPRLVVGASSFSLESESRIAVRLPFATRMEKPVSPSACGAALVKALGHVMERTARSRPKSLDLNSHKGIHVLVVDDNVVNQKITRKFLERNGISVSIVDNAASAITTLSDGHTFDAVLMDIQMPDMDGIEATKVLRAKRVKSANRERGWIPIFSLTADVMQDRQDQCRRAGMDGFISKPLDADKLYQVLSPLFPS